MQRAAIALGKDGKLAKPNHSFEKRRRELEKKRKQEEKRQKKLDKKKARDEDAGPSAAPEN